MRRPKLFQLRYFCLSLLALFGANSTQAAVEVTFYSRDFGVRFPHAFVVLKGTLDRSGEAVDTNYGFTAKSISPAILFGAVKGEVMQAEPLYIKRSDPHFALTLTDAEYDRLMQAVDRWSTASQPSYELNSRNCVYFVADLAESIGMSAPHPKGLMKKPKSYTERLTAENRAWLEARGAKLLRPVRP